MSRDTLFPEPYEKKGYNPSSNYHCDNPLHGYGCYHLDKKKAPNLNKEQQAEFDRLNEEYYIQDIDEVVRAVSEQEIETQKKRSALEDEEAGLDDLYELERLWKMSGLKELEEQGLTEEVE